MNLFEPLFRRALPFLLVIASCVTEGFGISDQAAEMAVLLKTPVIVDSSVLGDVVVHQGEEAADAVYRFGEHHDLDGNQREAVLEHICQSISCGRKRAVVWSTDVSVGDDVILRFELMEGEEPADAAHDFVTAHGLDDKQHQVRESILRLVCEEVACVRTLPAVYRKAVQDQRGNAIGSVEVLEGEEVADAIHRFVRESKASLDPAALKNYFFQSACGLPRLKCTRIHAIVFDRQMILEDGSVIGRLTLRDDQEPADAIYEWSKSHGLDEDFVFGAIEAVCNEDGVRCSRSAPIIKSFPLSGPDGVVVGIFEVKLRQEPADALYGFFARHGLFEKKWDFETVLSQLCDLPGISCNRNDDIKFSDEDFSYAKLPFPSNRTS